MLNFSRNETGRSLVENVLLYWLERCELSNQKAFFELIDTKISHEVGENIMSFAEQLRQEGELKGELKGKLEVAKRLLDEGADIDFVLKVTGLSFDKIKSKAPALVSPSEIEFVVIIPKNLSLFIKENVLLKKYDIRSAWPPTPLNK